MGDAHDSDFVPADQGSICVQRERGVEDLPQDAHTDLQYACKDGWDKSDLQYVHEAFGSKCKHRCFLLFVLHSPPGHGRSHWKGGSGDLKTNQIYLNQDVSFNKLLLM